MSKKDPNELLPKNNAISLRLDKRAAQRMAQWASDNDKTITGQARAILKIGMEQYEKAQSRKKRLLDESDNIVSTGIPEINDLFEKVRLHLSEEITHNGKVFKYEPTFNDCMSFIVTSAELAITREEIEAKEYEDSLIGD